MRSVRSAVLFSLLFTVCAGCFTLPQRASYEGPADRPPEVEAYYPPGTYSQFTEEVVRRLPRVVTRRFKLLTSSGFVTIDYLDRLDATDDSLILVFPALGGKNVIENYFAEYIADHGFDTAIVHRNNEFKDPKNADHLEEILREGVIRDRTALDFFERELGKHTFGTFGISRGGINVALTAGIDARLKYNVVVLGGTDLVGLFRKSNQSRIQKYIKQVCDERKCTRDEYFERLHREIKSDPKYFTPYIDARNTLLILGVFDKTVPFQYGMKLRDQVGGPETVLLMADHYIGLLFTGFGRFLPPGSSQSILPLDYVETESLAFYRSHIRDEEISLSRLPYRILQSPVNLLARAWSAIVD